MSDAGCDDSHKHTTYASQAAAERITPTSDWGQTYVLYMQISLAVARLQNAAHT